MSTVYIETEQIASPKMIMQCGILLDILGSLVAAYNHAEINDACYAGA
jgi:hypothetical protein